MAGPAPGAADESYRTDCTDALVALCREARPELAWFASDFGRLEDLRQHDPAALGAEARRLALDPAALARSLRPPPCAGARCRATCAAWPRRWTRRARAMAARRHRRRHARDASMIGAGLAACPAAPSAAAAARAMGDPVLLSAREDERLVEFLRGGFGDAIVSDGAPGRLVTLALSLAGPELADLPRIWALLSQHPAEIMRLPDRGRLDQGCRADLVVVARDSGAVEATISAGRLIHLTGQARDRFAAVLPRGRDDMGIAAE
ncbi:hypothetical protein DPM13_04235 [Paracoccus mutanolyticus]|uniref:Amidohydrolase-related domain-containing protein n=1 Tax=Paracoccus mutanolyticus TaxID=1499308 RepID=A0ABN5M482_9RHOB|nr:hypothetical protein [Paracoccus mutanolyticus]AWX92668.1 hypothetical protein DPM13_04235 [Paracoccus mutanolyticus]